MNVSLNWLTDYVDVSLPAAELAEVFTRIGLNCEGIEETDADIVFDLEVTSNRPDCLGHLGVARELATALGLTLNPPELSEFPSSPDIEEIASLEVCEPELCPRYTARVLRNLKVGPSPQWLVERLEAVGLRSVNNVVDVTNFVLMEYCQPLHSFDYDKLADHTIIVRTARDGETMTSIDETLCKLDSSMLVIADAEKPVAIAGVMGGLDTEVGNQTTSILLESAQFDPLVTRKTSRKLALMSESNYRFERGVDPVGVELASRRACELILELAGGELVNGMLDQWANPYEAPTVSLRPERCNALLGYDVPADRQQELLAGLGLEPSFTDGRIVCTIPSHRADLRREADLIEEVARLVGYDVIPVSGQVTHPVKPACRVERIRQLTGSVLSAAGYDEAITFAFLDAKEAKLLGFDEFVRVDPLVRKTNNVLRPSLIASLLKACKTNQDVSTTEVSLWELSAVFPKGQGVLPDEYTQLAMVTTGDLRDLRGAVEVLMETLCPTASVEFPPAEVPAMASGLATNVVLEGDPAGHLGVISPEVQDYYGLEKPIAVAALNFTMIAEAARLDRTYQPVPRFPGIERDLSLVIPEDTTWSQIQQAIGQVSQPLRAGLDYVTTYRGEPIAPGHKSMTVTLTYRSPEGTLRSEDVDEQILEVVTALKGELGAQLRK